MPLRYIMSSKLIKFDDHQNTGLTIIVFFNSLFLKRQKHDQIVVLLIFSAFFLIFS